MKGRDMTMPSLAELHLFFSFFFQKMAKVEETGARSSQTEALNGHLNFARIIDTRRSSPFKNGLSLGKQPSWE